MIGVSETLESSRVFGSYDPPPTTDKPITAAEAYQIALEASTSPCPTVDEVNKVIQGQASEGRLFASIKEKDFNSPYPKKRYELSAVDAFVDFWQKNGFAVSHKELS